MIESTMHSLPLRFFENLFAYKEIRHVVSTRLGGHSAPPYDTLNLSFHVGDDPARVLKNRSRLAESLGIPLTAFTTAKQVHDCQVKLVSDALKGRGATDYPRALDETDAMITNVPGICLMILLADCVPVILYDPVRKAAGVAHAGWKGTLDSIAQKTVLSMAQAFGSLPEDLVAGIGPSIGPCCYEVGPEVVTQINTRLGTQAKEILRGTSGGKAYLNLWTANLQQLEHAGVQSQNIELARTCTYDHAQLFFSYRHAKGPTGRFGAGIVIVP